MTRRKFRFGVLHRAAPSRAEWQATARHVEDLGYDVFLMSEHFMAHFGMAAGLVAAAEATSRLRVGSLVYDVDFRHPAVLAKEAATIDVLSEGRFELGLGAEIGISTDRFHARGPCGLRELTSYKYVVHGDGHVRE